MKLFVLLFIYLGFSLSMIFGIQYSCSGPEMLPEYFASPFVFKRTSLGSSMEFFYSIIGVFANWFCWTIALFLIQFLYVKLLSSFQYSIIFKRINRILLVIAITFSILSIAFSMLELRRGFDVHSSYWHFDIEQEAKDWGGVCKSKMILFFE